VAVELDPGEMGTRRFYRLLTAVVVPRPIAWVSSRSAAGVDNLAPHSFFTVACAEPPILQFTSVGVKDTLRNVEETGEFVVCLAPEPLFEEINATATDYPPGTSEFDAVGLERAPSLRVAPPRVAASPVALECRLHSTLPLGDSTVVLGLVVHAAVADGIVVDGHPEIDRLRPLARLGKNQWTGVGEVRAIPRIRYADIAQDGDRDGDGGAGRGAS
jgi:flavin reductase (DIM6/NTAB) family NADH-FMN oxidoreductase RutF